MSHKNKKKLESAEQPVSPSIPQPTKDEHDAATQTKKPADGEYHGGKDPDPSKS